jgi:hypothetical protein
MAKTIIER